MYLALGGVYLLLSAVCSNNATLREGQAKAHTHTRGQMGLTPAMEHSVLSVNPERLSAQCT